ncbi:MAG TPA: NAD(P)/FAD-dependent oxidoreductase [Rhodanobacteraceae bacterium]|jgi:NADH dehydrogenase|nr:NAD(P)/FAD-dependent oxidoreductase [Rhodanobacteraceae bacterium]
MDAAGAALPHVVILGGGFGGLCATKALARAPVRITLIDRANHHLFQPLLYQVAAASLSGPDISAPLRHIVRKQCNVTVWMGEVEAVNVELRQVHTGALTVEYDYLVVATGSIHAYFGHDAWEPHAPGLKTMGDALSIRRRVLSAFEAAEREPDPARRAQWLAFVIVGAGPTGVELAGTLAEMAQHTLPREFRRARPRDAQIHLVEAGPRVLASMPEALSAAARRKLERMGVQVHCNARVTNIDATGVQVGDTRIAARTVLWAAGVAASTLGAQLGAGCDRAGRVQVVPDLSLPGHPEVFVIGDLARVEQDGAQVPGMAPAAKQMGAHAARAIRDRIAGSAPRPFRYRDFGSLASISRSSAVVAIRGWRISGLAGWLFWLIVHIFFLIGFRNRFAVMWNWAWSYLTWQRYARIIVGRDPLDRASRE